MTPPISQPHQPPRSEEDPLRRGTLGTLSPRRTTGIYAKRAHFDATIANLVVIKWKGKMVRKWFGTKRVWRAVVRRPHPRAVFKGEKGEDGPAYREAAAVPLRLSWLHVVPRQVVWKRARTAKWQDTRGEEERSGVDTRNDRDGGQGVQVSAK